MPRTARDNRPPPEPALLTRLHGHFEEDPARLPVVGRELPFFEWANLQLALAQLTDESIRRVELVGIVPLEEHRAPTLALLSRERSAQRFDEGPVETFDVPLAGGRMMGCVKNGLLLFRDQGEPCALLVAASTFPWQRSLVVEVMARQRTRAEDLSRQLLRWTHEGRAFRGHAIALEQDCHQTLMTRYLDVPTIERDQLILPAPLLQRIERFTVGFDQHASRLRAAQRHLRRGLLLHGPPGTGKTLTAMYLLSRMRGRTAIVLTGAGMGAIEPACQLARQLAPATVILEDADLIGTERHHQHMGANALLFELLNQMDGLPGDSDVFFILTTNRPDMLEPALAARPGRIDQAFEIPLPDAECRVRLLDLFGRGLRLSLARQDTIVERTHGVSAAFLRELLRRAAVFAATADGDGELVVRDEHVEEALAELQVAGGRLTQSLLGGTSLVDDSHDDVAQG